MNLHTKMLNGAFAALLLSGCGGTGQDDSTSEDIATSFQGIAIDGQLMRAFVYLDTNDNNQVDSWEPFAFTDNDGYFSTNLITNVDYCAVALTEPEADFCLRSNISLSGAVLRIEGGYDVLTGERFEGSMSSRVDITDNVPVTGAVVSPLTTLFETVTVQSERDTLLTALGLSTGSDGEDSLTVNYLDASGDGSNEINSSLLNAALKVHKVVTVLSDRLQDTYDEVGDDASLPTDATGFLYESLADTIINSSAGTTLDTVLEDSTKLADILDQAEDQIRNAYRESDLELPDDIVSGTNTQNVGRVVELAQQIPDLIDEVIDKDSVDMLLADAISGSKAIEIMTQKIMGDTNTASLVSTPELRNDADEFFDFFTASDSDSTKVTALLDALEEDNADLAALITHDFDFDDETVEEIAEVVQLPATADPFTALVGKSLKVSDTAVSTPGEEDDKELIFFFQGVAGETNGTLSACIKFIDEVNGTAIGTSNTKGEILDGHWSLLKTTDYSVTLVLNFLNNPFATRAQSAGVQESGDTAGAKLYRFDFDKGNGRGEGVEVWESTNGVETTASIPTSAADCEVRLPSRIGL